MLAVAIEANIVGQFRLLFAHLPQIEIHDEPDMVWVVTNIPHHYLNCVLQAQLAPEDVDPRIEETLTHFSSRHVPMSWRIGPSTQPADLGKRLAAHGLIDAGGTIGMAVDLLALKESLPSPPNLTIELVRDEVTLEKWAHIVAVGFEYPESVAKALFEVHARAGFGLHLPWRLYLGLLEGQAMAASRLFLAAGVAGIYAVSTLPEARRQGIGTALTLAPVREARTMGYRIGVLHAEPEALGVYRRLGFREYCRFGFYVWAGDIDQAEQTARGA